MVAIVVLTGAGISAESGLGTFRDTDGVWTKYDLEDVATPQGFVRNPELVQAFYNARRSGVVTARPNAAHEALAKLEASLGAELLLVTQNVDDLHERGGAKRVVHMHGELLKAFCASCQARRRQETDISVEEVCADCGVVGQMRPDVVWFGEIPYHMDEIYAALSKAEMFVSIGTSGQVYPAAGFVEMARDSGAACLELNLEATNPAFTQRRLGPATEVTPAWVDEILNSGG
ncbi:MAG: NAD-dependent deacylase [Rhodobacteraceae bacterium]|nr:NAD-dependent deacylase [Paracoccaceae bacterium]